MRRMSICAVLFSILSLIAQAASEAPVSSLKSYQDDKELFRIQYPAKWKINLDGKKEKTPVMVSLAKPDSTIILAVMKAKVEEKQKAVEYLNQMDQSRKMTNQVPEKMRTLVGDFLTRTKANDAAIGYYEIPGKTVVLQRVLCLRKKDQMFVLTGTFQKNKEIDDDPLVESLLTSFEFIEAKKN